MFRFSGFSLRSGIPGKLLLFPDFIGKAEERQLIDIKEKNGKSRLPGPEMLLIILLFLCIVFSASVGSSDLTMKDSFRIIAAKIPLVGKHIDISNLKEVYIKIVWDIRMPRIIMAGLVGCGLSVVGAVFQGLFKNPLADPHILGVSSGAAAGATVVMITGIGMGMSGLGAIGAAAFIGAVITVFFVYRISCVGNRVSTINIVLTGTAVSTMLSSFISLMMAFNHEQIEKVYMWTLGSFSSSSWTKVIFLACMSFVCIAVILFFSRELDVVATGNDTAESLGIDTAKVKKILIVMASFLVAACVSVSGIIGFVGLVVPHSIRIMSGPKHRRLLPLSCIGGAVFVIICDTIARNAASPSEIPVGVVTAVLGTPYFLFLLQRSRRKLVA